MLIRTLQSLLVVCLLAGAVATSDPFVGKWKLDTSKSKLTGEEIIVKALAGNKFSLTFPGNITDTLIANGKPQRVRLGYVVSLTAIGPREWRFAYKLNGDRITSVTWILSRDAKTISIEATGTRPDGSQLRTSELFERTVGSGGFAGTWKRTRVTGETGEAPEEQVIRPYDHGGLTFDFPAWRDVLSIKFDGQYYPETGPGVPRGAVSSARRLNDRAIDETEKVKGQVLDTMELRISQDGKTLTVTEHDAGQSSPQVFVYRRE